MLDAEGNTVSVDATAVIAVDVELFSAVWRGRLDDLPGTSPNEPASDVMSVVLVNTSDDIKARSIRRTIGLKRAKDRLPVTV